MNTMLEALNERAEKLSRQIHDLTTERRKVEAARLKASLGYPLAAIEAELQSGPQK